MELTNFKWEELLGDKLGHLFNLFYGVMFWTIGISLLTYARYFDLHIELMMILTSLLSLEIFINSYIRGLLYYTNYIAEGYIKVFK